MKVPTPLNGWRVFAGEVGIIVLGVLIALGAQQAVDTMARRSEVDELTAALNQEIAFSLSRYQFRMEQDTCLARRLGELERWLESWREGRPLAMGGTISAPRSSPPFSSVWASRDPAVMSHMKLETKLAYSAIYDEFANNEVQRQDERMTWFAIGEYENARELDANAMMRLQGLLMRARWRAGNISSNARDIIADAKRMGIEPRVEGRLEDSPMRREAYVAFCKPLVLSEGKGA